jgi:type VI secretion system secreted protein Hcp
MKMAVYMKIEGLKGIVEAEGYKEWMEIHGVAWNCSRSINNTTSSSQDRGKTLAYVSAVNVTKQMDVSSPKIFIEACQGSAKKVEIHHTKIGEKGPEAYLKYVLTDTLISSYQVNGDGENIPYEVITLNFTKIEMNFIGYDKTTKQATPVPAIYDLTKVNKGS